MSLRDINEQIDRELNPGPPGIYARNALIVANGSIAEIARRNFDAERFHLIYPGMAINGFRFVNVFVSGGTHSFITRANPRGKAWMEEEVMPRIVRDGHFIVLP